MLLTFPEAMLSPASPLLADYYSGVGYPLPVECGRT